jgi:ABC-type antimicrobial peptide transport system permease subunit
LVNALSQRLTSPLPVVDTTVLHQQAQLDEVAADPTLQASGTGILALAFVAVLGLSTLGFVVTLVLGARNRAIEFAVLRAVGSSSRQILRAMLIEWGSVLVIGGAIGVLLGRRVAAVMLSFLDVTDQGAKVLPPFVLETNWQTLALGVGVLIVIVVVGLGFTWVAAMRRADAATLRITQ